MTDTTKAIRDTNAEARFSVTWPLTAKQKGSFLSAWKRSPFPQEHLERRAEFLGVSQTELAALIPRQHWERAVRTCEECSQPFTQLRNPGSTELFHVCAGCASKKAHLMGVRAHAAEGLVG